MQPSEVIPARSVPGPAGSSSSAPGPAPPSALPHRPVAAAVGTFSGDDKRFISKRLNSIKYAIEQSGFTETGSLPPVTALTCYHRCIVKGGWYTSSLYGKDQEHDCVQSRFLKSCTYCAKTARNACLPVYIQTHLAVYSLSNRFRFLARFGLGRTS